jgi:LuxR family transcriptional regulator, maltose regulon positive regulatory protein
VLEARQKGRLAPSVSAHYIRQLLAALERDEAGAGSRAAALPEPLSERELEVLVLIAAGKSNRKIATELFLTVGTVKTQAKNVYRKLGAHSRTEALVRELRLQL